MLIPESYYKDELNVKLTAQDIEMIIDELERQPHNLYEFQQTEKLINKLKDVTNPADTKGGAESEENMSEVVRK